MKVSRLGAAALLLGAALALSACSVDVEPNDSKPKDKAADSPAEAPDSEAAPDDSESPDVDVNVQPPGLPDAAAGGAIVVNGNGSSETKNCANKNVVLNGNLNNLTYTGTCATVTVNGNDNKVTIGTARAVIFNGSRNKLTYSQAEPSVIDNDGSNSAAAG